jgi:hypothetical protein
MDLTSALLNALHDSAGPDVRSIALAAPASIILTHVSGTQLLINVQSLAPHIMGGPEKLVAEARGALATLNSMADTTTVQANEETESRIVPVLRPADWIERANRKTGSSLVEAGLAIPFGRSLHITFAIEHTDRRIPVLDRQALGGLEPDALPELARANQLRMVKDTIQDLSATNLHMGDGTFFLRSKNLQAASLILQPFAWHLISRFAPDPPLATLGAVVGPDVIVFGPGNSSAPELYADMLRATLRGLRKSLGDGDDWGDDIFTFTDMADIPTCLT